MSALSSLRAAFAAMAFAAALVAPVAASAQARAVQPRASTATAASQAAPVDGVVNINSATEDELRRLPLVGPARAAAIVALRARVQRFRSTDDLQRVRGIGRASMRRLRPYLTLVGETTLLARPGRAPRTTPAQGATALSRP